MVLFETAAAGTQGVPFRQPERPALESDKNKGIRTWFFQLSSYAFSEHYEMSNVPNKKRGIDKKDFPYS